MGEVIYLYQPEDPPPPPLPPVDGVPRVCATCEFHKNGWLNSYCRVFDSYDEAVYVWDECNGHYWMKKRGIISKIKAFFS